MVLTSTSVLVLEWTLKNGCCQYLCHLSKSQSPLPLPGPLQDQQGGLTQAPFKLHLPLVSEHARFCVCPLRIQSVSHIPVALLKVIPTGFQGLIFLVQEPWARGFNMDSDSSLLEENLCNCNYPPICGLPAWEYGSWLYSVPTPSTHLTVIPLYF